MKLGKSSTSKLTNVTFTTSDTPTTGKDAVNILDNDLFHIWETSQADTEILMEFDPVTFDAVTLHNITARSAVTIEVYKSYPDKLLYSTTIKATDFSGFFIDHAVFDFTELINTNGDKVGGFILGEFILNEFILGGASADTISAINIIFSGGGSFASSLGYIWAGDLIDYGCSEKIGAGDSSNDDVTISRTNHPDVNDRYEFQTYTVTLKKTQTLEELQAKLRPIYLDGYGKSRPVIFTEPIFADTNVLLGILDAPKAGYDIFQVSDEDEQSTMAQVTIGIRETF